MPRFIPKLCDSLPNRIIIILLLWLCTHNTLFADLVVPVSEKTDGTDLRTYAQILPDCEGTYSSLILSNSFNNIIFKKFDKNLIKGDCGNYWMRFYVKNKSLNQQDWIVGLGNTNENITIYKYWNNKLTEIDKTGALVPANQKKLNMGKDNIVSVEIPPDSSYMIYLHFENKSAFSKQMFNYILEYLKIYSRSVFDQKNLINRVLNGLFYGAILIMFFYNLFIAISLHSRDYYSYIIFMFLFFLFNLFSDGYASETFLAAYANHDRMLRILVMPLMFVAYIYFSYSFLKVKQYVPGSVPGLYIISLLLVACYIPIALDRWWFSRNAMIIFLLIGIIYVFAVSVASYVKGYKPAIYFTIANTLLMISGILYAMNLALILKNKFLASTVDIQLQVTSVLEISIFSLGLANRIKIAEKEKQRMISEQNIILEENVKYRTEELNATNEELHQTLEQVAAEKLKSDKLLLNILPEAIANELKEKGSATPQYYDMVTVIFADFVNFTHYAETHTPDQTTKKLDKFFFVFDQICTKYQLEKIKTIGDCYMAAGGLPIANETNAHDAVKAALEMLVFVEKSGWELRIGIHTGPVVAGVIGINKFAYDIWGDAVNVAARMEQTSESNRINISNETYELIKDHFSCTYRGKIQAKNKGEIDMYFVN